MARARANRSALFVNCIFDGNAAVGSNGGGMHCYGAGTPVIDGCEFTSNHAETIGGGLGSAFGATPIVINCTFRLNIANAAGGGIGIYDYSANVQDCEFTDNQAYYAGGGLYTHTGTVSVTGCSFETNSAHQGGGIGMASGMVSIANSSFCGNDGGHADGDADWVDGTVNCFVWDCSTPCRSDVNADGGTDVFDLLTVIDRWGECPTVGEPCPGDVDVSHEVGIEDMLEVLARWGNCP